MQPLARHASARLDVAGDGTVAGYASLFGTVDPARDRIMPGAFAATLRARGGAPLPMLFGHDPATPVGLWYDLHEDTHGLFCRGRLLSGVQRGAEVAALIRAGVIDGLSIGFRTKLASVDPRTRVRSIYALDLWEISIVTFPLLDGARLTSPMPACKYRPDQPRVPAGNPDGGQWTDESTDAQLPETPLSQKPLDVLPIAPDDPPRSDLAEFTYIANQPAIRAQIEEAWKNSDAYGLSPREHGFWICRDDNTGELFTRPFQNPGTQNRMIPGPPPADAIATFHTHPNREGFAPGPSIGDRQFAAVMNLPGFIRSHPGMYYYGPPLRERR